MHTFISMLRGINLGSHNKVAMPELVRLYTSLGLVNIQVYVQSGNLVFASDQPDAGYLSARIEGEIRSVFGYDVNVFIRDPASFQRLLDRNPFTHERDEDPARLHVTFLFRPPTPAEWSNLGPSIRDTDEFSTGEQEVFLFCPNGYGRTRLSNSFFERKLGQPATTRNWRTVNALFEMVKMR
jgi:uncharacterized protein (DUF1697 family)